MTVRVPFAYLPGVTDAEERPRRYLRDAAEAFKLAKKHGLQMNASCGAWSFKIESFDKKTGRAVVVFTDVVGWGA